jgi:hypothetical protein
VLWRGKMMLNDDDDVMNYCLFCVEKASTDSDDSDYHDENYTGKGKQRYKKKTPKKSKLSSFGQRYIGVQETLFADQHLCLCGSTA